MSDIVSNLKDAINPSRREKATPPGYDPQARGAYVDNDSATQPQLAPPKDGVDYANAADETATGSAVTGSQDHTMTAPDRSPKLATNTNFNAPRGTYGPHESRLANVLDPRVDSNRDGHPAHGISGYRGAAARPVDQDEK
ncbi:hypothetical protein B0H67DRAFT_648051 [Lasiosphaeris hirsuta]|uniref:Uncharacterized protein n=1 Tax=Lasiosphaeris hirsuta TaxID=260670 RepID=A0AA40A247_9PEZI|nr:hypothetical protein B0H67DRAFT_648051 [Lasiosphaeris hirsuta]